MLGDKFILKRKYQRKLDYLSYKKRNSKTYNDYQKYDMLFRFIKMEYYEIKNKKKLKEFIS